MSVYFRLCVHTSGYVCILQVMSVYFRLCVRTSGYVCILQVMCAYFRLCLYTSGYVCVLRLCLYTSGYVCILQLCVHTSGYVFILQVMSVYFRLCLCTSGYVHSPTNFILPSLPYMYFPPPPPPPYKKILYLQLTCFKFRGMTSDSVSVTMRLLQSHFWRSWTSMPRRSAASPIWPSPGGTALAPSCTFPSSSVTSRIWTLPRWSTEATMMKMCLCMSGLKPRSLRASRVWVNS